MKIKDIDHLTITVSDLEQSMRFYHEVLDLPVVSETPTEMVFQLGKQKLICRTLDSNETSPARPTVGSAHFSIMAGDSLADIEAHLANYFIKIIKGPVEVQGHNGKMNCIYINDPDQNLLEICETKR